MGDSSPPAEAGFFAGDEEVLAVVAVAVAVAVVGTVLSESLPPCSWVESCGSCCCCCDDDDENMFRKNIQGASNEGGKKE